MRIPRSATSRSKIHPRPVRSARLVALLASAVALLASAVALSGCARGCSNTPRADAGPAAQRGETAALPRYFPLTRGDRWRTRGGSDGSVSRVFGVTGVDARGVAVVFGAANGAPERYTASATEIARVDEQGMTLVPLLRAPLDEGAHWEYALAERGVSVPCEARVVRVDTTPRAVGGAALTGCVTVHRVCRYPAGTPFPLATAHSRDETYCPLVGLVQEVQRFTPPPAPGLLPAQLSDRLVSWNVSGGPLPPRAAPRGCDNVLLLPSDVQAACGAALMPVGERTGVVDGAACLFRFAGGGHEVDVRVERSSAGGPAPATPAAVDDARGPHLVVQAPSATVRTTGCEDSRLGPLFRSLFP